MIIDSKARSLVEFLDRKRGGRQIKVSNVIIQFGRISLSERENGFGSCDLHEDIEEDTYLTKAVGAVIISNLTKHFLTYSCQKPPKNCRFQRRQ